MHQIFYETKIERKQDKKFKKNISELNYAQKLNILCGYYNSDTFYHRCLSHRYINTYKQKLNINKKYLNVLCLKKFMVSPLAWRHFLIGGAGHREEACCARCVIFVAHILSKGRSDFAGVIHFNAECNSRF